MGFFFDGTTDPGMTPGSGYSPSEDVNDTLVLLESLSEFKAATANGTQTATAGGTGGADALSQIIVVFTQATLTYEDDTPPRLKSGGFDPNVTVWQ